MSVGKVLGLVYNDKREKKSRKTNFRSFLYKIRQISQNSAVNLSGRPTFYSAPFELCGRIFGQSATRPFPPTCLCTKQWAINVFVSHRAVLEISMLFTVLLHYSRLPWETSVFIPFNFPTWFFKLSRSDMWNSNDNRLIIKIFQIIFASELPTLYRCILLASVKLMIWLVWSGIRKIRIWPKNCNLFVPRPL